jgi:general secretion pathway protein D
MASFGTGARTRLHFLLVLGTAAALAGCAAQRAYRDGEQLIAQDKLEPGLARLAEARAAEPSNALYAMGYLKGRDRAVQTLLAQAESHAAAGDTAGQEAALRRVLAIEPDNSRAQAALRLRASDARHAALLAAAEAALAARQPELARYKARQILAEAPRHAAALALLDEADARNPPPPPDTALAPALRKPVSLDFHDAPLRQVFDALAVASGLNFVFDKDIKPDTRATIRLRNSTVEAGVAYLLMSNQLEQQILDANTIAVYPANAAKAKEYQEMRVRTFQLAYADVKNVANVLRSILKVRDVAVDEKLSLVIVRDNPDVVRMVERLVALQDVAEPEVMLDVEVMEVQRARIQELGLAWPASVTLAPLTDAGGGPPTVSALRALTGDTIGVTGVAATVNANAKDGVANILANPRIRVRNKEKAKVLIGDKVPNISTVVSPGTGGFASESVNYIDVGLNLTVEPTISLANDVAIRIGLEVSNVVNQLTTPHGTVAYQIGTRQATTMLQLKDGETQVLAGLINNAERSNGNKLPGLGDLPLVGRLFGSARDDAQKTEIVLAITPHLVRGLQRPSLDLADFSAGTETGARRRPDGTPREAAAPAQAPPEAPAPPALPPAAVPVPVAPPAPAQGEGGA